jgi:hypothetical protein
VSESVPPSGAEILLIALELVEAAATAASKEAAVDAARSAARSALSEVDLATAQRVAACLAVECASALRSGRGSRSVQEWVERLRLEATWAAS